MLGFETARQVAKLGRGAFFPEDEPDLPARSSTLLREDDLSPQFGYVGAQYPSTRILLLGINPGNGDSDKRSPGDARMMPAIVRFSQNPTESNFVEAAQAYMRECQSWRVWTQHCAKVINAGKLSMNEIAYANCLPWRTASLSDFHDDVAEKAARLYLLPLIEELAPCLIVAMGKKRVESMLQMTKLSLPPLIIWNRSRAEKAEVKRERTNAIAQIRKFVGREMRNPGGGENYSALPEGGANPPRPSQERQTQRHPQIATAPTDVIKVLVSNPKQFGSKSRKRFDCYRDGMTVAEYERAVTQLLGGSEARKCKDDLKWDSDPTRCFIRIERNS